MKMRPVGAELFSVDGWKHRQTDTHDEANSRFSQFFDRVKNRLITRIYCENRRKRPKLTVWVSECYNYRTCSVVTTGL